MTIKTVILRHIGTGGEAAQTFLIPIHPKQRTLHYAYYVSGAANGITNSLQPVLYDVETGLAGVAIGSTVFNLATTNQGAGTAIALARASHLLWTVRSNAATANNFILHIGFADV